MEGGRPWEAGILFAQTMVLAVGAVVVGWLLVCLAFHFVAAMQRLLVFLRR